MDGSAKVLAGSLHQSEGTGLLLRCYPILDRSGLEFFAFLRPGELVSPAEFAGMIGRILNALRASASSRLNSSQ